MNEPCTFENEITVFNFLIETGCCERCALRFICINDAAYMNPPEDLKKKIPNRESGEQITKKLKSCPCIVCLDLLKDETIQSMVSRPEVDEVKEYDCETFVNYISFPKAVLIRDHSLEIYVTEKFPDFFDDRHIIAINRAWSLLIQDNLTQRIGKTFDKNSLLQIQFKTTYELEEEESLVIPEVEQKYKKSKGHKNGILSIKSLIEFLGDIKPEEFKKRVLIPPQAPTKSVVLEEVSYKHDYIFIAGRYCKYARNMFQTPWKGEEAQVLTRSVQEIIFEAIDDIFRCGSLVFSASGREDFDVRMLGRGRPFFVKIGDPKITKIPSKQFRLVEETIKQSNLLSVRDLQSIDRQYVSNIKHGEQFKKKTYRALCIVDKPEDLESYIDKINTSPKVTLEQRTPLRVYHRRSSNVRKRDVYSMKARCVNGRKNLLEIDMVTEAGTYVKEFVHGDLGRTTPSISEIIGTDVDILALDVLDIHLDFPPPLGEENNGNFS